jgi:hypothetical protein
MAIFTGMAMRMAEVSASQPHAAYYLP